MVIACWVWPSAILSAPIEHPGAAQVGTAAPDFEITDTNGNLLRSQDLRGRVLVLNFWGFWCDTWKAELPYLKTLAGHERDSRFSIVAVSVDGTRYAEFERLTQNRLPFPVCLDDGSKVTRAYHVTHVPTVVIVDPSGRIAYVHAGYPGNDAMLNAIRRISAARGE